MTKSSNPRYFIITCNEVQGNAESAQSTGIIGFSSYIIVTFIGNAGCKGSAIKFPKPSF
jgi:hypothetical protein